MTWEVKGFNSLMITLDGETVKAKWVSWDKKMIMGVPGMPSVLQYMSWITPEEAAVVRNRPRQSVEAPEVPYPSNLARLATWLSSLAPLGLASPPLLEQLPGGETGFTTKGTGSSWDSILTWRQTKTKLLLDLKSQH